MAILAILAFSSKIPSHRKSTYYLSIKTLKITDLGILAILAKMTIFDDFWPFLAIFGQFRPF